MQNKNAVIYCRVSTKEQVEEGNSLATQERICKEYALKNGYDVIETFIEQGESAKTQDRPEFNQLLKYCTDKKNLVSAVIAYKVDRISRNTLDYSQIRARLRGSGVEMKFTSEHFEDNPAGRFMENIIANVAQFDNDVRTERCIGGMQDAAREGRYVWRAPLGYDNTRVGGKTNIAPNKLAPLIRKAFEEIAKNYTHVEFIRLKMAREGLVGPKGTPVAKGYFYRLIRNELYTGWINKFGERHKGIFEPIISEDLFAQVQRVLKYGGRSKRLYQVNNSDFPLRRFIKHPSGLLLTGGWSQGKRKKYPYYQFRMKGMNFKRDYLETKFINLMNQFRLDQNHLASLGEGLKKNLVDKTTDQRKEAKKIEAYMVELRDKQNALVQKNLGGTISDIVLKQQLESIDMELMNSYVELEKLPVQNLDYNFLSDLVEGFLLAPGNIWADSPFNIQLELQVFKFPQGLTFDGVNYRTPKIRSIFKLKDKFLDCQSPKVNSRDSTPNIQDLQSKINWEKISSELQELSRILQPLSKKAPYIKPDTFI